MSQTTSPFDLIIQLSRRQVEPASTPQIIYALAEIKPRQSEKEPRRIPLNLSLVLDRSTSMRGERLQRVKAAANLVIEKMAADDIISIISYSDRAEVVVPSSPAHNKLPLTSKVRSIMASGGTEIYQGLKAGLQELRKASLGDHVNHLILLTDGHTYGDAELCLELATQAAGFGIGFSAFGIGSEWNDEFLDQLVAPSGGQSGFIAEPEQIIHFLRQRIQSLGMIYAQNLLLSLDLPAVVTINEAFKLAPFAQPLVMTNKRFQLGAMEGSSPVSILLELTLQPELMLGDTVSLPFEFRAVVPSRGNQEEVIKQTQSLMVLDAPTAQPMPENIIRAVQLLNMYRMNEQVWREVESGNIDAATKRMERLTTRFRDAGFTNLAQHASSETQRLAHTGTLSLEGRKALKYGTRVQLTSSLDLNLGDSDNAVSD